MTYTWEGTEYRILFRHDPHTWLQGPKKYHRRRGTVCLIQTRGRSEMGDPGKWLTVGSGAALCSLQDQFVKETGRRIALVRAVSKVDNMKAAGAALACYYGRKRGRTA